MPQTWVPQVRTSAYAIGLLLYLISLLLLATPSGSIRTLSPSNGNESLPLVKGDTLFGVLGQNGLNDSETANLINLPHIDKYLTTLLTGDELELSFDGSHRLTAIMREIDLEKTLTVKRAADNLFGSNLDVQPLEKSIQTADLKLDSSLFVDRTAHYAHNWQAYDRKAKHWQCDKPR